MIRSYADSTGKNVAVDANGWPLADSAQTVVFDARPFPEWQCPSDPHACVQDPWVWEQPVNGTYYFNLTGKATVAGAGGQAMIVLNQTFDAATYTTSGYMTMPVGAQALCVLSFTGTQRSASDAPGSGFTNLRIMRPGHFDDADTSPCLLRTSGISAVTSARFTSSGRPLQKCLAPARSSRLSARSSRTGPSIWMASLKGTKIRRRRQRKRCRTM